MRASSSDLTFAAGAALQSNPHEGKSHTTHQESFIVSWLALVLTSSSVLRTPPSCDRQGAPFDEGGADFRNYNLREIPGPRRLSSGTVRLAI